MATTPQTSTASAGAPQLLTAVQSLVLALNNAAQTFLNINGASNVANITAATVVKGAPGRLCEISILVAGSAPGIAYDSASLSNTTRPLFVIPNLVGVFKANWPVTLGIVIVPGSGQTVSITYS